MSADQNKSRPAEAGHWGQDIRSDLHVAIEPRDTGGLEVGLESRVAPYYGEAILTQTRQVLETLGVKNAKVSIHDEGALPYVIAARIETAARRARAFRERPSAPLPPLSSRHRAQVHH
jgi:citrate lyase subunit beta / citryl-CoA lyase